MLLLWISYSPYFRFHGGHYAPSNFSFRIRQQNGLYAWSPIKFYSERNSQKNHLLPRRTRKRNHHRQHNTNWLIQRRTQPNGLLNRWSRKRRLIRNNQLQRDAFPNHNSLSFNNHSNCCWPRSADLLQETQITKQFARAFFGAYFWKAFICGSVILRLVSGKDFFVVA